MICSHTGHTCTWPPHIWIACVFPVSFSRLPCGQVGHNQRAFLRVFIVYESSVSFVVTLVTSILHIIMFWLFVNLDLLLLYCFAVTLITSIIHFLFRLLRYFIKCLFLLMKWLFQLLICDQIDHNHNWMTNVLPIQTPFRCCLIVALIAVIINSNQHQIVSPGGVILELLFYPAFSLVKKQEKVKRTNTFLF